MSQNVFLLEFFSGLNKKNINYVVLRNYQSLPNNCGGSDLDLWVAEKDVDKCLHLLQEVSEKTKSNLVSYTPGKDCPKYCFLNTEFGVQIDLFKGVIICKGKALLAESDIVKNIKVFNGIRVLDDRLGDLVAFLKEIINNGKCTDKYIIPLYEHKECFGPDYFNNHLSSFSNRFKEFLFNAIENRNIEKQLEILSQMGRKDLGIFQSDSFFQKVNNLKRIFNPTGYTIAVLGTDGSGKSFIINAITPILGEAFHNGIKYEHMRPNYMPSIAVLTGRKEKSERAEVCSTPHASKPSGFIGSMIRLSYYWLDYTWGYFRKVYFDKSFKTHVWLFDRYYYDYYLDQRRARLNLPNWIVRFYGIFVPCPDITICLGGDPQKIYARKPETSLEEVSRQIKKIKDFSVSHKKTIWVDTTVSPEESINAVMVAIVKMMSKRYVR